MLLMNTGMMIYIFVSIYRQKMMTTGGQGANRSQKKDMICLYLRLFLGMGFIWYFEILSWVVEPTGRFWVIADALNMLQVSCFRSQKQNVPIRLNNFRAFMFSSYLFAREMLWRLSSEKEQDCTPP